MKRTTIYLAIFAILIIMAVAGPVEEVESNSESCFFTLPLFRIFTLSS
ncbi:MAG: hypothetical protein ABR530_08500 [Pyrinomonadaceae bacterium]